MKLRQLYNQIIKFGSQRDPRGKSGINSYADTAILYGRADQEIKKVLVGIDIEAAELLLAEHIRQRQGLDLVMSHHPEGRAYAVLAEVMRLQVELLKQVGVAVKVAQGLIEQRQEEVTRRILPQNHLRPVDAARLLDLPFMCVHTPADNHASSFIQALLKKEKPRRVGDIIDILIRIPEYKEAAKISVGPRIILGNPKRKVGKMLIEMTGGTEGSKNVFDKLYKAGVRTLVSMHLSEEHLRKVKDANLNVVIAGHISSDTLGLNLLLDRIEKEEKLEIIGCSGFKRFRR